MASAGCDFYVRNVHCRRFALNRTMTSGPVCDLGRFSIQFRVRILRAHSHWLDRLRLAPPCYTGSGRLAYRAPVDGGAQYLPGVRTLVR